jgi:hypothetical protein
VHGELRPHDKKKGAMERPLSSGAKGVKPDEHSAKEILARKFPKL